jgi:ankyrin repeat protein
LLDCDCSRDLRPRRRRVSGCADLLVRIRPSGRNPLWILALTFLLAAPASAATTNAPLADATEHLDTATIERLLAASPAADEINAAQVDGMTALHWAVYHDRSELVQRLLDAGAAAAAANRYGVVPLSLACANGNPEIVDSLLAAGADPNALLAGGETVFMTAARTGRIEVVEALYEAGADVHFREPKRGQTALMWAAAEGNLDVVELLLEVGADPNATLDSGFTPLLFAVREGRIEVMEALLRAGVDVNSVTPRKPVKRKRPLPGGRSVRPGSTPLLVAVTNGHFELAARLLDAGADPNAAHPGYTALHMLARVRKPGAGDNNPRPDGSGAMDGLGFVHDMVEHGADLEARMTTRARLNNTSLNELGATPFVLAALVADAGLMRTLADLGADPLSRTDDGSTALMAAAGLGTRSPGEDAGTEDEVLEAVQLVLDLGADIDAVNANGETPMHGAAYKNLPRVVHLLADSGADIEVWNQRNKYGWTPLTIARGYRFGNFKPSPVTIAAIETIMLGEGVRPPTEEEEGAKAVDIYAKPAPKPAPDEAKKDEAKKPPAN